ncbi:MAG: L-histidine N(alpha)-methyltransferase [Candidatus Eisenbacteria bacterium]|nr:L-histidine N(alpha)-methyltransferase [Candidatus Eisenbacteria bacterium]
MRGSAPALTASVPDEARARFLSDVLAGLHRSPKRLPSKYFYDHRGSWLFDRICELPEYYPTRTELSILRTRGREIARSIGPACQLIELGAGSTLKIRLLLETLDRPHSYVPVDISGEYLRKQNRALDAECPELRVIPVAADFMRDFTLPARDDGRGRRVVFFPGSTIGNLTREEAIGLLRRIARLITPDGGLLIGIDLVKSPAVLEAAYNDCQGVTAAFNLNVLRRVRDELGAELDLAAFAHHAYYRHSRRRIEMHLVSRRTQQIVLDGERFQLMAGETIHTENSHKYELETFAQFTAEAGLRARQTWTDARHWFAVQYLECD